MIVADTKEERQAALDRLLPLQQQDFKSLLEVMSLSPVVIRLLDPPIHEFLPNENVLVREIAELQQLVKNAHGLTGRGAAMTLMQAPDKVRADVDGLGRQLDPMLVESVIVKKERRRSRRAPASR